MLKGRKKKNHGFRMMEREIKEIKREFQLKGGKERCPHGCVEHIKNMGHYQLCRICGMAKTSPYISKRAKYLYYRNKPARRRTYWCGVNIGVLDQHTYDYWLEKREEWR